MEKPYIAKEDKLCRICRKKKAEIVCDDCHKAELREQIKHDEQDQREEGYKTRDGED